MASYRIGITDDIAYLYRGVRRYAVLGKFTDTPTDVDCVDDSSWKDFIVIRVPDKGVYRVYSTADGADPVEPELLSSDALESITASQSESNSDLKELQAVEVVQPSKVDIRKERARRLVKSADMQRCSSLLEERRMSKQERLRNWLEDRRNGRDKRLVGRCKQ